MFYKNSRRLIKYFKYNSKRFEYFVSGVVTFCLCLSSDFAFADQTKDSPTISEQICRNHVELDKNERDVEFMLREMQKEESSKEVKNLQSEIEKIANGAEHLNQSAAAALLEYEVHSDAMDAKREKLLTEMSKRDGLPELKKQFREAINGFSPEKFHEWMKKESQLIVNDSHSKEDYESNLLLRKKTSQTIHQQFSNKIDPISASFKEFATKQTAQNSANTEKMKLVACSDGKSGDVYSAGSVRDIEINRLKAERGNFDCHYIEYTDGWTFSVNTSMRESSIFGGSNGLRAKIFTTLPHPVLYLSYEGILPDPTIAGFDFEVKFRIGYEFPNSLETYLKQYPNGEAVDLVKSFLEDYKKDKEQQRALLNKIGNFKETISQLEKAKEKLLQQINKQNSEVATIARERDLKSKLYEFSPTELAFSRYCRKLYPQLEKIFSGQNPASKASSAK